MRCVYRIIVILHKYITIYKRVACLLVYIAAALAIMVLTLGPLHNIRNDSCNYSYAGESSFTTWKPADWTEADCVLFQELTKH